MVYSVACCILAYNVLYLVYLMSSNFYAFYAFVQSITTQSRIAGGAPPRLVGALNPREQFKNIPQVLRNKRGNRNSHGPPRLDRWFTEYPEFAPLYLHNVTETVDADVHSTLRQLNDVHHSEL